MAPGRAVLAGLAELPKLFIGFVIGQPAMNWNTVIIGEARRSGRIAARTAQIPRLIVRVRFSSLAPTAKAQVRG